MFSSMRQGFIAFDSYFIRMQLVHRGLAEDALTAFSEVIRKAAADYVRKGMVVQRLGSQSGAFVTGNLADSIDKVLIDKGTDNPSARVGTPVQYGLYWEIPGGHANWYTGRQERDDWLTKALGDNTLEATQSVVKILQKNSWGSKTSDGFRARSRMITKARSFLYDTAKLMGDINSIVNLGDLTGYRVTMLKTARILGDVNAVRKGNFKARVGRRIMGRVASRGLFAQVRTGTYPVPRRIMRRYTGAKMGRLFSTNARDHMRLP